MLIIPAIDLIEGKCVRLEQGDYAKKTVYSGDPVKVAEEFAAAGAELIHIVDLDGARAGSPQNLDVVKAIARTVPAAVEYGGGLRDLAAVEAAFAAGAERVVLGTVVLDVPAWFLKAVSRYGERIVVGIDAREGKVAVKGWRETTDVSALDLALRIKELGIQEIIYTDIARDGMLKGPNLNALQDWAGLSSRLWLPAGFLSGGYREPEASRSFGVYAAIIGKALYTNQIDLAEAIRLAQA